MGAQAWDCRGEGSSYPNQGVCFPLGTIMMSGCGILTNGKGTRREYCEFSLDELQVRVGHSLGTLQGNPSMLHPCLGTAVWSKALYLLSEDSF